MRDLVVIERTDTRFSAYSPDLPGCVATGATQQDVEVEMRAAVAFHLEGLQTQGLEAPLPQAFSTYVDVPA